MLKKYVVELNDENVTLAKDGYNWLRMPISVEDKTVDIETTIQLLPYIVPDLEKVRKEAYDKGYDDCRDELNLGEIKNDAFGDGYKCGLSDLWEAVRKIMNPFQKYKEEVFDGRTAECIFDVFTPSKVIAKIKAWEEEKQEIKVGDIVRLKDNPELKIWVTNTQDENGMLFGIELKEIGANKRKFERTGEHHEIAAVLETMREGQEQ